MIIKLSEKVLTLLNKPTEDDAFRYFIGYDETIRIILNKEKSGINNSFNN